MRAEMELKAIQAADEILARQSQLVLIDGPAGAGKTSFAKLLSAHIPAAILHADDFYSGWEETFDAEFASRLSLAVKAQFQIGLSYQKYDWKLAEFQLFKSEQQVKMVILEGVGSFRISLNNLAVFRIFLTTSTEIGIQRVINRDGQISEPHIANWKNSEAQLFETYMEFLPYDLEIQT